MSATADPFAHVPAWQLSIRAKCAHPTGRFVPFEPGDVQQSIPDRFHSCVRQHGDRLAVQAGTHSLTYRELNRAANGWRGPSWRSEATDGNRSRSCSIMASRSSPQSWGR